MGDEPGVGVDRNQECLVVEHLLEVWDEPWIVDGIAGEPAPDMVVDPAECHPIEGRLDHVERDVFSRTAVLVE